MARRLKTVRDYRDVEKALRRANITWTECKGSHRKASMPDGTVLVYHTHHEYGRGLACKLTKILTAAGLLAAIVSIAVLLF